VEISVIGARTTTAVNQKLSLEVIISQPHDSAQTTSIILTGGHPAR